jgi:hypothetical protein
VNVERVEMNDNVLRTTRGASVNLDRVKRLGFALYNPAGNYSIHTKDGTIAILSYIEVALVLRYWYCRADGKLNDRGSEGWDG